MSTQEIKLIISGEDKTQQAIISTGSGLKYLEGAITKLSIQITAFSQAWNAAMSVVHKGVEYIDLGGKALKSEEAFHAMATSLEVDADRMTAAMKKAADGFVDDSDLMQKAAFAMDQNIDPKKIPELFEAARVASRKTGADVGQAVDGMVQGIATNMPRSLRQMGAITKEQMTLLNKAMADGATEVNLLDLVLANAAVTMARLGPSANNTAKDLERTRVLFKELEETIGKGLITAVSWLAGQFYSLASSLLSVAEGYHRMRAAIMEKDLAGMEEFKNPDDALKKRIAAQKAALQEQRSFAEAAAKQAAELRDKGYSLSWGVEPTDNDAATEAQRKEKLRKALEQKKKAEDSLQADLARQIAARELEQTQKRWGDVSRDLGTTISGAGLTEFEKELLKIQAAAEKLTAQFGKLPGAKDKIQQAAAAESEDAARKAGLEDFDKYLDKLNAQHRIEKETTEEQKRAAQAKAAATESEIQNQLAELEIAEKLQGADKETNYRQRIKLLEELKASQEGFLNQIDRLKDPTGWNTQQAKVIATRRSILELQTTLSNRTWNGGALVALNEIADRAKNVGQMVGDAVKRMFDSMNESLVEFTMNGKFNFTDFANSVIRDMLRIYYQQQITGPLASAGSSWFASFFGANAVTPNGGVGFSPGNMDWEAGMGAHSGIGPGDGPSFYRIVPSALFHNAVRYHSGVGPGEKAAIIRNDESVLTPGQMRALGARIGGGDTVTVNLTVVANDAQSFRASMAENKSLIVGIMQDAWNKRGRKGPLGV